jgi:hypothetical protein
MGDLAAVGIARAAAEARPLTRFADLFRFRTAPAYRMAPPLRNPHYVGLHIAVASRSTTR